MKLIIEVALLISAILSTAVMFTTENEEFKGALMVQQIVLLIMLIVVHKFC